MTTNTKKTPIDEKQKKAMCAAVFKDYPEFEKDPLQHYYIERLVESYLVDPDTFNRKTDEFRKKEKKGQLPAPKPLPEEIVGAVYKGENKEANEAKAELTIGADGMIKSAC
jgi:hypothetical protein